MTTLQAFVRRDDAMQTYRPVPSRPVLKAPVLQAKTSPQPALLPMVRSLTSQAVAACKWLNEKRTQQFSARRLRVSETVALGDKRFVSIVQVDGAQILVGSSAGNVSLLAILDQEHDTWISGSTMMEQK
jgi:hypothetical protein